MYVYVCLCVRIDVKPLKPICPIALPAIFLLPPLALVKTPNEIFLAQKICYQFFKEYYSPFLNGMPHLAMGYNTRLVRRPTWHWDAPLDTGMPHMAVRSPNWSLGCLTWSGMPHLVGSPNWSLGCLTGRWDAHLAVRCHQTTPNYLWRSFQDGHAPPVPELNLIKNCQLSNFPFYSFTPFLK